MTERTIPVELTKGHPHAGARGVCFPEQTTKADGVVMYLVKLDQETTASEVYAAESEFRRVEDGSLWDGVDDHDRRLAEAMELAGLPRGTINKARQGMWSDFKSPLAGPKIELVAVLERHGADDLAKRVIQGEFDG